MADKRKKTKQKAVTVTNAPAPKKKRGKEKKLTLSEVGAEAVPELEKPAVKPVKPKPSPPEEKPAVVSRAYEPNSGADESKEKKAPLPPASDTPSEKEPLSESPVQAAAEEEVPTAKPAHPPRRINILFVCTGNTCRSAMAQYIFSDYVEKKGESEYFDVKGAGLSALNGDDMSEQAKQVLFERDIRGVNHFARRLTREMLGESDLVVCMTEGHYRAIGNLPNVTTVARITGGADVPDPWGGSLDDYRKVAAYLEYACGDVYDFALEAVKREKS